MYSEDEGGGKDVKPKVPACDFSQKKLATDVYELVFSANINKKHFKQQVQLLDI